MNCSANIVYSNTQTSLTSALGSSTVFTAVVEGLYRLSAGLHLLIAGSTGGAEVLGTLALSGTTATELDIAAGGGGSITSASGGGLIVLPLKSGESVALSTSIANGTQLTSYDVFVVIEQLS